jgi:hypothetical protein
LKELLDVAKTNANDRDAASRELAHLEAKSRSEADSIRQDEKAQAELIRAMDLGPDERDARLALLSRTTGAKLRESASAYGLLIAEKKEELRLIQERIDARDAKLLDEAKKRESILGTERQLFDLERQKIVSYYEAQIAEAGRKSLEETANAERERVRLADELERRRLEDLADQRLLYNPRIEDQKASEIMARWANAEIAAAPAVPDEAFALGALDRAQWQAIQEDSANLSYLISLLGRSPYENSVPGALSAARALGRDSVAQAAAAAIRATNSLKGKEEAIASLGKDLERSKAEAARYSSALSQFEYALSSLASGGKENGYILDPRDPARMAVSLSRLYQPADGTKAWVFRGEKALVGAVEIFSENGSYFAKVRAKEAGKDFAPFDMIMLDLKAP